MSEAELEARVAKLDEIIDESLSDDQIEAKISRLQSIKAKRAGNKPAGA